MRRPRFHKTSVVILAAGFSRRLGRPKQQVLFGTETLLARSIRIAKEAALGPVFVVMRPDDLATLAATLDCRCEVIFNEDAAEGVTSSIRAGVRSLLGRTESVLFMTCDQPKLKAEHLIKLKECSTSRIVASAYSGTKGIPALFPASSFQALLHLSGDSGARSLLHDATAIKLSGGEIDIDTESDLKLLQIHAQGHREASSIRVCLRFPATDSRAAYSRFR